MSKNGIGVALIGYGFVGEIFHAPLIESTEGLDLAVISSSKPEKVHAHFPGMKVASTPEAAIVDPAVELVVIASPNTSHVPLATAALHAGKHVVVDKPFTITTEEARGLATLAEEKQRILSVFHNRRWDAEFQTLRKLVADDTLGPIHFVESHIDRFRPLVRDRWREQPGPGAGLWYDLGPHLLDQMLVLFGAPATVHATILGQRPGTKTDDYAHVILGYEDGRQVILHCTMWASGGAPRFTVHGERASWRTFGFDIQESQLIAGVRPGDAGWGVDPIEGTLFTGNAEGRNAPPAESAIPNQVGAYEKYYAGLRDAILGRGPNPVPADEAILVMAVLEAAFESAERGERIRFSA